MTQHITIGADRVITVPDALKEVIMQYDHRITTFTFDCPRYYNEIDLSTLDLQVVFQRSDEQTGIYPITNVTIDESDTNTLHFDWTVEYDATEAFGWLAFQIHLKKETDDQLENHWATKINRDLFVGKSIACEGSPINPEGPGWYKDLNGVMF